MSWQTIILYATLAVPFAAMTAAPAHAQDAPRVSGPVVHQNLAVYFLHGPSADGPAPLTLQEAMAQAKVVVHETGSVNMLSIENTGGEEVFVQAGDIVKGGQQDRVLTISMLVPARSGKIDIGAYCVEQGRWSQRGKEDVRRFASADMALPSRDAKLAMLSAKPARAAEPAGGIAPAVNRINQPDLDGAARRQTVDRTAGGGSAQSEVWLSVAKAQRKLTDNLGAPVAAAESASSLQLTLENERLRQARSAFLTALEAAPRDGDIVGYVFAVGGKLNSGDVYASNALFKKMWSKQLQAAVTEAIAEKDAGVGSAPGIDDVRLFLERAEKATSVQTSVAPSGFIRETRDSDTSLLAETRRGTAGVLVHRAYVAR